MEKSLSQLKRDGSLSDWSDSNIRPGQSISKEIRNKLDNADIVAFLFSQNFIASEECMKEWKYAISLSNNQKPLILVPIILTECSWQDVLGEYDFKALPNDAQPVSKFPTSDDAWHDVYKGIKDIVGEIGRTFSSKKEFLEKIEETEALAKEKIRLKDIYIFLNLTCYSPQTKDGSIVEDKVTSEQQLLKKNYILIHGEEMSGKTSLARHLYLHLIEKSEPVLLIDLEKVSQRPTEQFFCKIYQNQFNGDYLLWKKQSEKTLILDNFSAKPSLIDFIEVAKNEFDRLIIILSSDVFNSYFRDDHRLAEFYELKIQKMTHEQQEKLIRKRLALLDRSENVSDGQIDQVENHVNSIIISNRILPRYPFYVLSILQTYEAFMPSNLSITSYGHCYYALILASLIKSGISRRDDDINACFNFSEHLAFRIYQIDEAQDCTTFNFGEFVKNYNDEAQDCTTFNFGEFVKNYNEKFIISDSILNRLKHSEYGVLKQCGDFRVKYMYYYFLGKFLSKNRNEYKDVIEKICENSHQTSNYLTIIFVIHHTNDDQIIDDILIRTMYALGDVKPAKLDSQETKRFDYIVEKMKTNILSNSSVMEERKKERDARDVQGELDDAELDDVEEDELAKRFDHFNDWYRILKNNKILEQILRNKYGNLERRKIEEIVETIADGGLRLVNSILKDEKEIRELAIFLKMKMPNYDIENIKASLRIWSFLWTMMNIEKVVSAINIPEIRSEIRNVVAKNNTPSYDLVEYFSHLDSAERISKTTCNELKRLFKKHNNPFIETVLSIQTQHYINSHKSKEKYEQKICSILGIEYSSRSLQHRNRD